MDIIKPKALKKGDTIGVFAPSSVANPQMVETAKQYLQNRGFDIHVHPQTFAQNGNHAGTDTQKIEALHSLFSDDNVDAIFCARGGNGLLQYVDQLDYDLIKKNPKPIIGFSDVTVLHHALLNKTGLVSFHGPIFQYMTDECALSADACTAMLCGDSGQDLLALSDDVKIIQSGIAEGQLIGGNLTLLSELTKTSDFVPQFANNIVFFEDTENYAYKHDRQLAGLFLNKAFRKASAFIVGVTKIDPDEEAGDFKHPRHTMADMMMYYINKYDLDVPVLVDAPISHAQPNQIIPHGVVAKLDASGEKPHLTLAASPFQP